MRAFAWNHPEWWVLGLAAIAWTLALLPRPILDAGGTTSMAAHHVHDFSAGDGGGEGAVGRALIMVVAMMVPLAVPSLRHAAFSTFSSLRHTAQALFLFGYVLAWSVAMLFLSSGVDLMRLGIGSSLAAVVALASAGLWQWSELRRTSLRTCGRTMPLNASGWRAAWDWTRYGVRAAAASILTCWGFMLALVVARHSAILMALFFAIQVLESNARFRHSEVVGTMAFGAVTIFVLV